MGVISSVGEASGCGAVGGKRVKNCQYEKILDAMPDTGVYVIRAKDRSVLYFNRRAGAASSEARLGAPCHAIWSGSCQNCPILGAGEGQVSRTSGYNPSYGGTVDLTAVRTVWEDGTPVYVVTVTPRQEEPAPQGVSSTPGQDAQLASIIRCRYRMLTTVYLDSGLCERVELTGRAEAEISRQGDYAAYIERAAARHVHPEDAAHFRATLSLEHLREKAAAVLDFSEETCRYRVLGEPPRWIALHVLYSRRGERVIVYILGQDVTREALEEEAKVHALEDRAYMISSLSSLFFSTYYVDVEKDTFRAVSQQRRVGDLLGNEVNFTAALQIYANHFIHPDDRAGYLESMSVSNLQQSLRWWQPYVTAEYRKLPEGHWVRATAVLARTDNNELPKTVVYVARHITESPDAPGD